jgi:uncharacterized protein YjbI with pentapeptide repeats
VVTETEPPPTSELKERSKEHSSSIPTRGAILAAAVLLGIIVYGYLDMPGSGWIGVANKKFWDYLDLLFVPAALALGVYWLNRRQNERDQQAEETQRERNRRAEEIQRKRELEVENRRSQDAALQTYLDQMSQLLTDKERPLHKAQPGDSLSTVARARTLTILGSLDSGRERNRKGSVVQFLYEAGLIAKSQLVLDLREADLSKAYLRIANLRETNLRHTNLSEADLRAADLRGADLSIANLSKAALYRANLSGTDLRGTDLKGANLSEADLSEAALIKADLSGANLTFANLNDSDLTGALLDGAEGITNEELEQQAETLEGATMPNGQKYEDWIKSRAEDGKNGSPS